MAHLPQQQQLTTTSTTTEVYTPHLHECGEAFLEFAGSEVRPRNVEHKVSTVPVEALLKTAFILGEGGGEGRGGERGGGRENCDYEQLLKLNTTYR